MGLRDRDRVVLPVHRAISFDTRLLSGLWSLLAVLLAWLSALPHRVLGLSVVGDAGGVPTASNACAAISFLLLALDSGLMYLPACPSRISSPRVLWEFGAKMRLVGSIRAFLPALSPCLPSNLSFSQEVGVFFCCCGSLTSWSLTELTPYFLHSPKSNTSECSLVCRMLIINKY